jgi:hypothetical protein
MPQKLPPSPPKIREQELRDAVNNAGVEIVRAGFDALDQLADMATRQVKKAIVNALLAPGKKRIP